MSSVGITQSIAYQRIYPLRFPSFNEPDLSTQSDLTPQQAADAWMQWCEPFAGQVKLISPAITNGGPPMGTSWMDEFLQLCTTCTIDGIAAHIYDSATNIGYYQSYITELGQRYAKPTYLTEVRRFITSIQLTRAHVSYIHQFGATGTAAQIETFLQQMVVFLENLDTVEVYAYFMDEAGVLVNSDGSLTTLGETYVSS